MICIVRNLLFSAEQPYRLVTHHPDDIPEFMMGKPMATLEEVKEAAEWNQEGADFFGDVPDEAESKTVRGRSA